MLDSQSLQPLHLFFWGGFFSCIAERAPGIVGQHSDIGQDNFSPEGKNLLGNVTNRALPKLLRNRS